MAFIMSKASRGSFVTQKEPLRFIEDNFNRQWMPPKTEPIPREFLEPALYSSGMTAQDSRALLGSCE
jgi:hypothetical protein